MKENSLSEREKENNTEVERINLIKYNKQAIDERDLLISESSSSTTSDSSPVSFLQFLLQRHLLLPVRQWLIVKESSRSQPFFRTTRIC
jgi:hypothetical protein